MSCEKWRLSSVRVITGGHHAPRTLIGAMIRVGTGIALRAVVPAGVTSMFTKRFLPVVSSIALAVVLLVATAAPAAAQHGRVVVGVGWGWGPGWGYGYGPYWGPGWGYGPYWGGPWGWGPGWGYPGYYDYPYAQARIQITPKQAEVFVDGYRAGIVDDFDGVLQRLNVWPGEHDVTIFLDGYKTEHHRLYFNDGTTANLKGALEKLGAGETSEPPPAPAPREQQPQRQPQQQGPPQRQGLPGAQIGQGYEDPRRPQQQAPPPETTVAVEREAARFGGVSVKVQPGDAQVVIDEQSWATPAGDARLNIQLQAGRHHVEIRKDGFTTYSEDVLIRPGGTLTLNVVLTKK
jgi:hypothetical protein